MSGDTLRAALIDVHLVGGGPRDEWVMSVPLVLDPVTWRPRLPASIDPDGVEGEYHLDAGFHEDGRPRYVWEAHDEQ